LGEIIGNIIYFVSAILLTLFIMLCFSGRANITMWPAIRNAMTRAYTDNRLTCGVVDCARQLEK